MPVVAAFTDGQSVLSALTGGPPRAKERQSHDLWLAIYTLLAKNVQVHLHYVPGHVGIPGNRAADAAAKDTAALRRHGHKYPTTHISFKRAQNILYTAHVHLTNTPPERYRALRDLGEVCWWRKQIPAGLHWNKKKKKKKMSSHTFFLVLLLVCVMLAASAYAFDSSFRWRSSK